MSEFLLDALNNADVLVTTTGTREYAQAILETLDPENRVFSKVYTREDQKVVISGGQTPALPENPQSQKFTQNTVVKQFFLGDPAALDRAFAFDDSARVWHLAERPRQLLKSIVFGAPNGNELECPLWDDTPRAYGCANGGLFYF